MGDDLALREERAQEITRVIEEMKAVKVNYEEKVREYEDLLDFRVLLKQEISIISSLFEEEESRYSTLYSSKFIRAVNWRGRGLERGEGVLS